MIVSTNREETLKEARASIRRNLACIKHKLRGTNMGVMEQVLISYARSLLIYFGAPLLGAHIWREVDIERCEKELYKEIMLLPNDLNRNSIINVVQSTEPVKYVIMRLMRKSIDRISKQMSIKECFRPGQE